MAGDPIQSVVPVPVPQRQMGSPSDVSVALAMPSSNVALAQQRDSSAAGSAVRGSVHSPELSEQMLGQAAACQEEVDHAPAEENKSIKWVFPYEQWQNFATNLKDLMVEWPVLAATSMVALPILALLVFSFSPWNLLASSVFSLMTITLYQAIKDDGIIDFFKTAWDARKEAFAVFQQEVEA